MAVSQKLHKFKGALPFLAMRLCVSKKNIFRKSCHCEAAKPTHPRVVSLALRAIHLLAIR
jgi:hypothetical protein